MLWVAIVALVAGVGMVGIWTLLLVQRRVPEIESHDRAIWFHLAAEYGFGVLLVVAGLLVLVLPTTPWVRLLATAAFGGMVYSCVNSPGYYARDSNWLAVVLFAGLAGVGTATIGYIVATFHPR